MHATAPTLLGLTLIVGVLCAVLIFSVRRVFSAARERQRGPGGYEPDSAGLSVALEEAIGRLKKQERETAERAAATERLSDQIISSLASGLLVVGLDGAMRIVNPAARRMLNLPDGPMLGDITRLSMSPPCPKSSTSACRQGARFSAGPCACQKGGAARHTSA